MLVGDEVVSRPTLHEVDDVFLSEVLLNGGNSLQHHQQGILRLHLRGGMETVVAVMTIILIVFLSEVMQQHLSATYGRLGVCRRLLQELSPDVLLRHGFVLHELFQFTQVLMGIEGDADTLSAISSSTSRLLVIALQALGDVVMDDETHVGLVDTHTKGDGGDDDIKAFHEEVVLCLRTSSRVKSSMIRCRLDIIRPQYLCEFLHLLAGKTIDDTALSRMLTDEHDNLAVNVLVLGAYLVIEVGTIEGTLELIGIQDSQVFLDVGAHLVGGSGSESNDGSLPYLIDNRTDTAVFRSEVVSPLRDTVSLIDGIEGNLHGFQEIHIILLGQRLWRDIKQFGLSCQNIVLHPLDSRLVQ